MRRAWGDAPKELAVVELVAVEAAYEVLAGVFAHIGRQRERLQDIVRVLVQLQGGLVLKLVQDHVAHLVQRAAGVDQVELEPILETKHGVVVLLEDAVPLANELQWYPTPHIQHKRGPVSEHACVWTTTTRTTRHSVGQHTMTIPFRRGRSRALPPTLPGPFCGPGSGARGHGRGCLPQDEVSTCRHTRWDGRK